MWGVAEGGDVGAQAGCALEGGDVQGLQGVCYSCFSLTLGGWRVRGFGESWVLVAFVWIGL